MIPNRRRNSWSRTVEGHDAHATAVLVRIKFSDGSEGIGEGTTVGGAVHEKLPVAWTLASGNSETDIAEAQEMIERRRHNIFKLKIGKRSVREDVAHVARIKEAVGDAASVRVDINTAWSLQEARWGLKDLQEVGCELVDPRRRSC